jgi:hypothetical protein
LVAFCGKPPPAKLDIILNYDLSHPRSPLLTLTLTSTDA